MSGEGRRHELQLGVCEDEGEHGLGIRSRAFKTTEPHPTDNV